MLGFLLFLSFLLFIYFYVMVCRGGGSQIGRTRTFWSKDTSSVANSRRSRLPQIPYSAIVKRWATGKTAVSVSTAESKHIGLRAKHKKTGGYGFTNCDLRQPSLADKNVTLHPGRIQVYWRIFVFSRGAHGWLSMARLEQLQGRIFVAYYINQCFFIRPGGVNIIIAIQSRLCIGRLYTNDNGFIRIHSQ